MTDVMTRISDFTPTFKAALLQRERRPLVRVTYCDLDWRPTEVITGEVAADSSFAMNEQGHRTARLRLWNPAGQRTPDPTSEIWYGRFVVDWGLRTAAGEEYVRLGRLVATRAGAQAEPSTGWATLDLESPSALWGTFKDYWVISANDRITDVIKAIALDAGESADNLEFYPTDEIVGADLAAQPGDDRWELARRIAGAAQEVGMVLSLDYRPNGKLRLTLEVDPGSTTAASWTFARGDGIMSHLDRAWENNDFANRILVYGGSGQVATIVSEIADTSAGPYGTARRGEWTYKWPEGKELDPLITTQERADARRDYLYRIKRSSQEIITLRGLVIPGFELTDVIAVSEPSVTRANGNYVLRGGYSIGLGPGGAMTLGARRVVRP